MYYYIVNQFLEEAVLVFATLLHNPLFDFRHKIATVMQKSLASGIFTKRGGLQTSESRLLTVQGGPAL